MDEATLQVHCCCCCCCCSKPWITHVCVCCASYKIVTVDEFSKRFAARKHTEYIIIAMLGWILWVWVFIVEISVEFLGGLKLLMKSGCRIFFITWGLIFFFHFFTNFFMLCLFEFLSFQISFVNAVVKYFENLVVQKKKLVRIIYLRDTQDK